MFIASLIPAVLLQVSSPPPPVSAELAERAQRLATQLEAPDGARRQRAEEQLLALGPEAAEVLLEMTKTAEPRLLSALRDLLPRYGPPAVPRLYFAARRTPFKQRAAEDEALAAVAEMGDAAAPELRRLLSSGDDARRRFALAVLLRRGRAARDELVALRTHPDAEVRAAIVGMLATLGDRASTDFFLEGLRSGDATVRYHAARGLGSVRERRAVPPLVELLRDPNPAVREAAVVALADMYERRSLGSLVRVARNDRETILRNTAARALIERAHDPVAARLGRRYLPLTMGPAPKEMERVAYLVWLSGTGGILLALSWIGAKASPAEGPKGVRAGEWVTIAVALALGVLWGGLLQRISGMVEWLLLLVFVPGAACLAWVAGPRMKVLAVPAIGVAVSVGMAVLAASGMGGPIVYLALSWLATRVLVVGLLISAVVAWLTRPAIPSQAHRAFRRAAALLVLVFYAGYGVGWLWLWGYLSS